MTLVYFKHNREKQKLFSLVKHCCDILVFSFVYSGERILGKIRRSRDVHEHKYAKEHIYWQTKRSNLYEDAMILINERKVKTNKDGICI
jgi:hypothetical protein